MEQEMRMTFDQSRDQCGAGKIDGRCLRWYLDVGFRIHGFDAVAANEYNPPFVRRGVDGIPHPIRHQEHWWARRRRGRTSSAASATGLGAGERRKQRNQQ